MLEQGTAKGAATVAGLKLILLYESAGSDVLDGPDNICISPQGCASETAGVVFSPDGQWLFLNIQSPGITVAITGPWHQGAL